MERTELVVWMMFPETVFKELSNKEFSTIMGEFSYAGGDWDHNLWIRRVAEPIIQPDGTVKMYRLDIPFGKLGRKNVSLHDENVDHPRGAIVSPSRGIKDHDRGGAPWYTVCVSSLKKETSEDGRTIVTINDKRFFVEKRQDRFIFQEVICL